MNESANLKSSIDIEGSEIHHVHVGSSQLPSFPTFRELVKESLLILKHDNIWIASVPFVIIDILFRVVLDAASGWDITLIIATFLSLSLLSIYSLSLVWLRPLYDSWTSTLRSALQRLPRTFLIVYLGSIFTVGLTFLLTASTLPFLPSEAIPLVATVAVIILGLSPLLSAILAWLPGISVASFIGARATWSKKAFSEFSLTIHALFSIAGIRWTMFALSVAVPFFLIHIGLLFLESYALIWKGSLFGISALWTILNWLLTVSFVASLGSFMHVWWKYVANIGIQPSTVPKKIFAIFCQFLLGAGASLLFFVLTYTLLGLTRVLRN